MLDKANFRAGGTVECVVDFIPPVDFLSTGTLVNQDGRLAVDVFFATRVNQHFTQEEIEELGRFLNLGGIVYLHSSASDLGTFYNPVLTSLGLNISFGSRVDVPSLTRTNELADSPVTNGAFGPVDPLLFLSNLKTTRGSSWMKISRER